MLKMWLRFLLAGLFLLPPLAVAVGQSPPAVLGIRTGVVAQNKGQTGCSVRQFCPPWLYGIEALAVVERDGVRRYSGRPKTISRWGKKRRLELT
jgi:hypothetical protein